MTPEADTVVLVTGAAGKIGRHVVAECLKHGLSVRALTSRPVAAATTVDPRVAWQTLDFLTASEAQIQAAMQGCVAVLHLAAEIWDTPKMIRVNVDATDALMRAAEAAGVVFFGFTSSIAVHGSPSTAIVTESSAVVTAERDVVAELRGTASIRSYARSKVLAERALGVPAKRVECVIFRPTVVVDLPDIVALADRHSIQRFVLSNRHEHHVYVGDVAHAMVWFLRRALARPTPTPGVTTFTLADDEASRPTAASFFRHAWLRTGDPRFRAAAAAPNWVYDWADMLKNRVLSRRRPFGLVLFPSDKIRATDYRHETGMDAAQELALDSLMSGASSALRDLA